MKHLFPLLLAMALFACGNSPENQSAESTEHQTDVQAEDGGDAADPIKVVKRKALPAPQKEEKVVMHTMQSGQFNMPMSQVPLPESWKIKPQKDKDGVYITGPHNLKINEYPLQSFTYSNDPYTQQLYMQSGQQMRALPTLEQLVQQDLVPWAQQNGYELVKQYNLEEVAKADHNFSEQLFKSVPMRTGYWAVGTEWKSPGEKPFFLLTHVFASEGAGLLSWYHYSTGLEADQSYFQTAIDHFVNGLVNTQYNPNYIMAYNQREAQKAGQRWTAHQQRMAQNQRNFEATQKAITSNNNAVSDMMMDGWKTRNEITDRGHKQTINSISDQNTMVDPTTGQAYQVETGANQYWINSNGEYISTDDYNYNPNRDPSLNNEDWRQMKDYHK